MGLHASPEECADLVRRYGDRLAGDRMGFEALVDTLCRARAVSIDPDNAFVRRYVTSLCSNEAVGRVPLSHSFLSSPVGFALAPSPGKRRSWGYAPFTLGFQQPSVCAERGSESSAGSRQWQPAR